MMNICTSSLVSDSKKNLAEMKRSAQKNIAIETWALSSGITTLQNSLPTLRS